MSAREPHTQSTPRGRTYSQANPEVRNSSQLHDHISSISAKMRQITTKCLWSGCTVSLPVYRPTFLYPPYKSPFLNQNPVMTRERNISRNVM